MTDRDPGARPRQTQLFLRELIEARGLKPKNKLGQNFLVDLNLIDFIVRHAELTRQDLVLEVGSGTGSLTAKLADAAGAVLSVEIDPSFHQLAQETLGEHLAGEPGSLLGDTAQRGGRLVGHGGSSFVYFAGSASNSSISAWYLLRYSSAKPSCT